MSSPTCILIEWPNSEHGVKKNFLNGNSETNQKQSKEAINMAMNTIKVMAELVNSTMITMNDKARPDEAELEFGIALDAENGALIAKVSAGAQIKVRLKWKS
ncbi:CU044_2847 family protein [Desulfogranum japonicum]|uniref:CU044_2847 family protein n=1 Tax=Desulfogranum japonicum TaxID=231447 RepID=UPI000684A572|nr:CU044_2847 family protein [Desulfogranum japonicum]